VTEVWMNDTTSLPAPARIGDSLASVDTPALLLDLDAFEHNLDALDVMLAGLPVRVRPHAKSHKCPEIARRQVARGAVGVCCQKVSEAEALVRGGIRDVLVVNEIVGAQKLARLARLAGEVRVGVAVDDPGNVDDLEHAAREARITLDVMVEVDVGLHRCGVEPGSPAVSLARRVADSTHLRFAGLQAYQGRAQHVRGFEDRRLAACAAADKVRATLVLLAQEGLPAATVTGGGTGTFQFDAATGAYTEVQPGSYIFMDADYARNLGEDGRPVQAFEQSLFVLTTVMSHPVPARASVDAGLKAHSVDSGMPVVHGIPGARFTRASDEHGVIELDDPGTLSLGQRIRLVPGHCDPTVNLHDWFVCFRGDRVEDIWPITARGAFY
jgi:D-serine deaminase-like pyridoxal phosphate-dependent protein